MSDIEWEKYRNAYDRFMSKAATTEQRVGELLKMMEALHAKVGELERSILSESGNGHLMVNEFYSDDFKETEK